jgi:hypothetical protein
MPSYRRADVHRLQRFRFALLARDTFPSILRDRTLSYLRAVRLTSTVVLYEPPSAAGYSKIVRSTAETMIRV